VDTVVAADAVNAADTAVEFDRNRQERETLLAASA
jgi:hypothetical protein